MGYQSNDAEDLFPPVLHSQIQNQFQSNDADDFQGNDADDFHPINSIHFQDSDIDDFHPTVNYRKPDYIHYNLAKPSPTNSHSNSTHDDNKLHPIFIAFISCLGVLSFAVLPYGYSIYHG